MTELIDGLKRRRNEWAARRRPFYGIVGGPPGPVRVPAAPRAVDLAAHGLPPTSVIRADRPGPDQRCDLLAEAAVRGDWRAAADGLADIGEDWERRYDAQIVLARGALDDDRWLDSWIAARPSDGTAHAIRARVLVELAWGALGTPDFHAKTAAHGETVHRVLRQVPPLCRRAAELRPHDPTPLITWLSAATGLGLPPDEFASLWDQMKQRAPLHVGAHRVALVHWSPTRRADADAGVAFVDEALTGAPRGSLLTMLRLQMYERDQASPRTDGRSIVLSRKDIGAAVDEALADLGAADPSHSKIPEMRHLLAHHLTGLGRYAEAVDQFRRLGAWCGADPWLATPDPVAAFARCRAEAVAGLEDAGPPTAAASRPPAAVHGS